MSERDVPTENQIDILHDEISRAYIEFQKPENQESIETLVELIHEMQAIVTGLADQGLIRHSGTLILA